MDLVLVIVIGASALLLIGVVAYLIFSGKMDRR